MRKFDTGGRRSHGRRPFHTYTLGLLLILVACDRAERQSTDTSQAAATVVDSILPVEALRYSAPFRSLREG